MQLIIGIFYHMVGASSATLCYTPQKGIKNWSWQTFWLAQALVCWLVLPFVVAWLTIPDLSAVLKEAPSASMIKSFLFGMAYGVGGTAFGLSIRHLGYSLTYAIAVGISCVLGTLLPPLVNGTLMGILQGQGSGFLFTGIFSGAMGIAFCGVAGRGKEKDLNGMEAQEGFSLSKGLPICIVAGVLSAFYGFSLDQGSPIADVAAQHGAGSFKGNVVYLFSNSGAFLTTFVYCAYLHFRDRSWSEFTKKTGLAKNYGLAVLTGILWYGQFFFYGLGHVRMGRYDFTSWAVHMLLLVLISALTGLLLKEWKGSSKGTLRWLTVSLLVLTVSVVLLTYGNYLGGQ